MGGMLSLAYNNGYRRMLYVHVCVRLCVLPYCQKLRFLYILAWTISQLDFELLEDRDHFFYFSEIPKYYTKEGKYTITSHLLSL